MHDTEEMRRRALLLFAGVLFAGLYYFEVELPMWRQELLREQTRIQLENDLPFEEQVVSGDGNLVIIKTRQDLLAQQHSDDYIDEAVPERNPLRTDYPALEDDTESYAPLTNGTLAWKIFASRGVGLKRTQKLPSAASLTSTQFSSGIHLISTFFKGTYEKQRFSEIVAALVANLENPYISHVHVLWEKENPAYYLGEFPSLLNKLVAVETKTQPTYAQMFTYANSALQRGAVAIVTNADIYFDSSIRCVVGPDPALPIPAARNRSVYALSRRPATRLCGVTKKADHRGVADLCQTYVHSHDAFVFAVPVPDQVIANTNHVQNKFGSENIIVWEFTEAKFKVWNPCQKIHALHLHCSQERHYSTQFIDGYNGKGPYRHGVVWPGTIRMDNTRHGLVSSPFVKCNTRLQ